MHRTGREHAKTIVQEEKRLVTTDNNTSHPHTQLGRTPERPYIITLYIRKINGKRTETKKTIYIAVFQQIITIIVKKAVFDTE